MPPESPTSAAFDRAAPIPFVFLWSTGWIVARYSAEHADPLTFLAFRFAGAGVAIFALVFAARAPFPKTRAEIGHALASGVLLHAAYLGGVWWAVRHGVPASISSLLAAVQPIATALLAPALLGEPSSLRRLGGVAIGLMGLTLVPWPKLAAASFREDAVAPIAVNVLAMFGATAGFFY
jgi:drug/metabolite transporter (DMT)-like permease